MHKNSFFKSVEALLTRTKNQKEIAAANKIICCSRLSSPWKRSSSLTWAGDLTQSNTHRHTQAESSCSFRSLGFSSLFLWNISSHFASFSNTWSFCAAAVARVTLALALAFGSPWGPAVVLSRRSVCLCVFRWPEHVEESEKYFSNSSKGNRKLSVESFLEELYNISECLVISDPPEAGWDELVLIVIWQNYSLIWPQTWRKRPQFMEFNNKHFQAGLFHY